MFTFSYPPAACRIYTNSFGLMLEWLSAGKVASYEKHFTAFALCTKHTKATNYNVCQIWSVFCGSLLEPNCFSSWNGLADFEFHQWSVGLECNLDSYILLKAGMLKLIYFSVRKAFSGWTFTRFERILQLAIKSNFSAPHVFMQLLGRTSHGAFHSWLIRRLLYNF